MRQPTTAEKHALIEAVDAFQEHGIEFKLPWEGDLDDLEQERYIALVEACQAFHQYLVTDIGPAAGEPVTGQIDPDAPHKR